MVIITNNHAVEASNGNNYKRQYLVGECKMDFPIATRIPFKNSLF